MEKLKNKPSLRFPEFDRKWENSKLGDITYKVDKKNKTKELLPIYSINNYNGFTPQSEQFEGLDSNERGYDISLYKIIENNTFAYNPARINVGSIGYSGNLDRLIVSSLYVCFKTKENINDDFFYKFVKTDRFINYVNKMGEGGVRIYLFYENFSLIPFSFPTLAEQTKINSFLTAVDDKLDALKLKKTLLKQYKKGVMQKIFSQELRFKDDNGNDYTDWEERKLGDCLDYIQPTKYLVSSKEYDNSYMTPVLTAGKTFILGYTNETNGIFENNLPVIIFDDFTTATKFVDFPFKAKSSAMKILIANEGINIKFIFEAMEVMNYEIGGHERHWISKFAPLDIFIPSYEEQTKIANFASVIDDKINHCKGQIEKTEIWKKGLLQQMLC